MPGLKHTIWKALDKYPLTAAWPEDDKAWLASFLSLWIRAEKVRKFVNRYGGIEAIERIVTEEPIPQGRGHGFSSPYDLNAVAELRRKHGENI